PPRCKVCKIFDHDEDFCPSRVKKAIPKSTLGNGCGSNAGNVGATHDNMGNGEKQSPKAKQFQGIRFSKPKTKIICRPVSKPNQADSNKMKDNAKDNGPKLRESPEAPVDLSTRDNGKSIYIQDDIDLVQLRENMNRLMEEDKVLDVNTDSNMHGDIRITNSNENNEGSTNNKSVQEEVKSKETGSLWEHFQEVKKDSTSKPSSYISDIDEE
nr:hypothetical protein [Tanacetum cinerariifolium]